MRFAMLNASCETFDHGRVLQLHMRSAALRPKREVNELELTGRDGQQVYRSYLHKVAPHLLAPANQTTLREGRRIPLSDGLCNFELRTFRIVQLHA